MDVQVLTRSQPGYWRTAEWMSLIHCQQLGLELGVFWLPCNDNGERHLLTA